MHLQTKDLPDQESRDKHTGKHKADTDLNTGKQKTLDNHKHRHIQNYKQKQSHRFRHKTQTKPQAQM